MPRTQYSSISCENFLDRISDDEGPDSVIVADAFQRGSEEEGVWNLQFKKAFIDSFIKDYPFGLIILVKKAGNPLSPWSILDGANKARCLRDFYDNKFPDESGDKYDDWDADMKAAFKAKTFTVQEVKVTRHDDGGVIAEMFERLNTKVVRLSAGELTNALGWQKDIWVVELARVMLHWNNTSWDDPLIASELDWGNLQQRWELSFGELNIHKRLNNMSFWTGIILSSVESNIKYFKKNYNLQKNLLLKEKDTSNEEQLQKQTGVFKDISTLLDFIEEIDNITLWSVQKGVPSMTKVAVIWHIVLHTDADTDTDELFSMVTNFYKAMFGNTNLREDFKEKMTAGGDNHINGTKIGRALEFIKEWWENQEDE